MSSTFSCYQITKSGLYVSQLALNVTGHNISNVNTEGYVRQQAMHTENYPLTYARYQVGTGASIGEVRQMRSIFLDNMYRRENSTLGYWQTRAKAVEDMEGVLNNLSEDGIQSAIDEFFYGWEEVAKDPENRSAREAVVEYGNNLVDMVNQLASQLDQMQKNLDKEIRTLVDEINSTAGRVAELNRIIAVSELNGDNANDYRDEQNALLDTLSEYVNIKTLEDGNGMMHVTVGGATLVSGTSAIGMRCASNVSNGYFTTVLWEKSGIEVKLKDGKLLGLIEARGDVDGNTGSTENGSPVESGEEEADVDADAAQYDFTGASPNLIPELRKGLNLLISLLTRKVNAIHRSGMDLDGNAGVDFFVKIDDNLPFEAGNIKVNPALDDPNKVAASAAGTAGDGSNASRIVDFSETEYFQSDGLSMKIDDFYAVLVDWVGIAGEEADNASTNQSTLLQQAGNKKASLSAVSMDEEMANMLKYQHAYNASAQVMNIVDGMMDKIINQMGRVGR